MPASVCTRVCTDERQFAHRDRVEELAAEILELSHEKRARLFELLIGSW
jgi:hypothetical protein